MTEYQLSLEGNLRLFFAMAIIVCGVLAPLFPDRGCILS